MGRAATRLLTDIRYSLLLFLRNRQSMFFSFVFPVLFMVALGYLLDGQAGRGQVDFLLPGIIGMSIMFSAINGTTGSMVRYRANGVFRKISTTPLTGFELNASRTFAGMAVVLLSSAIAVLMAWLVFGTTPDINVVSVLVLAVGSVTFVSLGMVAAYLIEDTDSVNVIAYVIIIPLILLSGSLFPTERLPGLLQFASVLSPLTYLNDGLRDSMFGGNYGAALFDLAFCGFLGFMLFTIGVAILMSREN
jgi:ABC-2 type transport system permease protein